MPVESANFVGDLVTTNPDGDTDTVASLDDQDRLIKTTLQKTFPGADQCVLGNPDSVGGTADAITAVFNPVITLAENVTVIVEAVGAITVTNPTFNPDSLGAGTIVKEGNQALRLDDIPRAGYRMILRYDLGNTNWELLNPAYKGQYRGASVYQSSGTSITPASTWVTIAFGSERYDTDSIHDNATNNSRLTVPSGATRVRLRANLLISSVSLESGYKGARIIKNGSIFNDMVYKYIEANGVTGVSDYLDICSPAYTVTGGDYFELQGWNDIGTRTATVNYTWFEMEIIE